MSGKSQKKQTGKVNYIWVLAGAYLIWQAWKLGKVLVNGEAGMPVASVISIVLFLGVGGWLLRREWVAYKFGMDHIDDPETWSDEPYEPEELPESAENEAAEDEVLQEDEEA